MIPMIESLEDRRLFTAVAPFGITSKGTLYVQGTLGNDAITVTTSGNTATVSINQQQGFTLHGFKRVYIDGAAGNDNISFTGDIDVPVSLLGGRGNDVLTGEGRKLTLIGGKGNDLLTANGSNGAILSGGLGDDVLHGSSGVDSYLGGAGSDEARIVSPGEETSSIEKLFAVAH